MLMVTESSKKTPNVPRLFLPDAKTLKPLFKIVDVILLESDIEFVEVLLWMIFAPYSVGGVDLKNSSVALESASRIASSILDSKWTGTAAVEIISGTVDLYRGFRCIKFGLWSLLSADTLN